jgi:hypothetical protein
MRPFFIMKKLGKGCFGSFGTHYRYFHYFLWEKLSCSLDLRPTWVTTSPRERIEFVSQGPTVHVRLFFFKLSVWIQLVSLILQWKLSGWYRPVITDGRWAGWLICCGVSAVQWEQNQGRCGICGDPWHLVEPRPHEAGGQFAKGVIGRHYTSGQVSKWTGVLRRTRQIVKPTLVTHGSHL